MQEWVWTKLHGEQNVISRYCISICFMTEHGVGMVYVGQGYKFVKPGIIFRWCK